VSNFSPVAAGLLVFKKDKTPTADDSQQRLKGSIRPGQK